MMVGEMEASTQHKLEDFFSDKQLHHIVKQSLKDAKDWQLVGYEIKQLSDGLVGFTGDHRRVELVVAVRGTLHTVHLFVKRVPINNKPKEDFINNNNYFKREALMFRLIEEFCDDKDPFPWCTKALVYNESLVVMPDLQALGYSTRAQLDTLDLPHALLAASALARFHAATANYETNKLIRSNHLWSFFTEHSEILEEPTFKDSPWLRAAAKLAANFIKKFSRKYSTIIDLEPKLLRVFLEACDSLKEYSNTLNVLVHKDLWINNIMYKYEKGAPVNAVLIDFQLLRYVPPAFDLMVFLYCTTSRSFREQNERIVCQHYYSVFSEHLEDCTKQRVARLGYDERQFDLWCEKSRKYGLLVALAIFPYVLMDPVTAQKAFDDPETYDKYLGEDRTAPVVAHCLVNPVYKDRQLELCEEFVERYIIVDN